MTLTAAATFETRVEKIVQETPDVRTLRLRLPDNAGFEFVAGQWAMLSFPAEPDLHRAYSMASSPLEREAVEISFNEVGEFSSKLFRLRPGDRLLLKGPYGKWHYSDDVAHAVLISGGTGITPFRSIVRYVLDKGLANRVTVLYSARTPSRILYRPELEDAAKRGNIRVEFTVTRPQDAPGESWRGRVGRIDVEFIRRAVPDFDEAVYFLCGPNALVDEVTRALLENGVDRHRIRREHWGELPE